MAFVLTLWNSAAIVIAFSLLIVFLDEFVVRRSREKRLNKKAAKGDALARELLRVAGSAKVYDE